HVDREWHPGSFGGDRGPHLGISFDVCRATGIRGRGSLHRWGGGARGVGWRVRRGGGGDCSTEGYLMVAAPVRRDLTKPRDESAGPPAVDLRSVVKNFGFLAAVNDVTFEV